MQKIILLATLILVFSSCTQPKYSKPFIVVYKSGDIFKGLIYCQYVDSNKNIHDFYETQNKYNIGDTIK